MGYLTKSVGKIKNQTLTLADPELFKLLGLDPQSINSNRLGEAVLLACLKFLSDSISKLTINAYLKDKNKGKQKQYDFYADYILNVEPNPFMNAETFWSSVELNRNFHGNAYIFCEFEGVKIKHLWLLPSDQITIWVDNAGIFSNDTNALWYEWFGSKEMNGCQRKIFKSNQIIHLKSNISWDGISGLSIVNILRDNIEQAKYGKSYLKKLYQNNMFGDKVIVQYTGDLNETSEKNIVSRLERFSTNDATSGKWIPLPLGMKAETLSMKLSDAEFSTLNDSNALQIAAAFGIKPNILNNYDKSSYSNSVTQQLDFFVNTLQPIIQQYKQELTRKLLPSVQKNKGMVLEHDSKELFKLDPTAQMAYLKNGMNNFMITPNEAREDLGYEYSNDQNADQLMGNGNYIKLDQVGTQWQKGGVKK